MLLKDKVAVIYGAGGAVGGATARAFAREGATVFLAGRTEAKLAAVADGIAKAGGWARAAPVDALDKDAVDRHAAAIIAEAGRIDVSFNAVDLGDAQGAALTRMDQAHFALPIATAMRTQFLTATAAARRMMTAGRGVILAITAQAGKTPFPDSGGFGVACAAIEAFCRQLAVEVGPSGVRVVCLRSSGSPDAPGVDAALKVHAANAGVSREAFEAKIAERTMLRRMPRLADIADAAALFASDHARAMTAAVANLTCGEIAD
jgi:NAD(P)-dependent dehydrogenase (short-subunit alcohol dehydrogenase family)